MKLTIEQILNSSYVVTIDDVLYKKFCRRFRDVGLNPLPRKFIGCQLKNGIYKDARFVKTSNVINCSISHLCLIQHAKLSDMPFICIFEDDAVPDKSIIMKLQPILENIPDDIDVLKLGTLGNIPNQIIHSDQFFSKSRLSYGTHAYMIFKRYYDNWLQIFNTNPIVDMDVINQESYNILQTKQPLFIQDFKSSSIHTEIEKIQLRNIGKEYINNNFLL